MPEEKRPITEEITSAAGSVAGDPISAAGDAGAVAGNPISAAGDTGEKPFVIDRAFMTYPRNFVRYKWFKPLLVGLIVVILTTVFGVVLLLAGAVVAAGSGMDMQDFLATVTGGYDSFDVYTVQGVITTTGSVAVMLLALLIAAAIVRDRPFSSYASSRGGWNWRIFGKSLVTAFLAAVVPVVISNLLMPGDHVNRFSVLSFLLLTIVGPLQCVAEEFIFRGLILQTVGSWTRNSVIAIVVTTICFTAMHPYNWIGMLEIAITCLFWCLIIHRTNGLEASSAIHIVNNMLIFYMIGFGISTLSSETTVTDLVLSTVANLLYYLAILYVDRKFHWFDGVQRDDVTPFNEREMAREMAKRR